MAKINHEEYEMLKGLDDRWRWIARDSDLGGFDELWLHEYKPKKQSSFWQEEGVEAELFPYNNLFQFIKWEDVEPQNIAELIEEYEKDYKGSWEHAIEFSKEMRRESEETEMKKDKKWLVDKWTKERSETDVYDPMYQFISEFIADVNQLDELEVLSPDWINDNVEYAYYMTPRGTYSSAKAVIDPNRLQNLLLPERELPVIPKFVAEFLDEKEEYALYELLDNDFIYDDYDELARWLYNNDEDTNREREFSLVLAQRYGYEVEEEQKYYVIDKEGNVLLIRGYGGIEQANNLKIAKSGGGALKLTEEEIKDFDPRYWPFRKPVEEVEENEEN